MIEDNLKTVILDTNVRYYGLSILDLMERAGRGAADFIKKRFSGKKIAIFCGLGNNGGDGFVAARYLFRSNNVVVFLIGRPEQMKTKEARENFKKIKELSRQQDKQIKNLKIVINPTLSNIQSNFDVVIDALFGVGVKGKLKEPYLSVIRLMNKMRGKKVAIDISSPGFRADYTISMHYQKVKNAYLVDLGIPKKIEQLVGPGEVRALFKPSPDSHKGDNGQLLIIAGSEKYHGAAFLAAKIASKVVDLVFFCSTPENNQLIQKMRSKLCEFIAVPHEEVDDYIKRCDCILIGPGMGTGEETKNITNHLLKKYPKKKFVLDADALKLADLRLLGRNCILTPHPTEFQTLLKIPATPQNVIKTVKRYKCVIVLKGKVDLICYPERKNEVVCKENRTGNAGMTKGGTGDVLAGLIAALACKNDLSTAACAGTFLNGLAGDRLFKKVSYYYSASDLISEIPKAIKWSEDF